jgi:hypothetical protein
VTTGAHPLFAVARHPTASRLGLSLVEYRDGDYLRLAMLWPMLLFKRADDPDADLDQIKFAHLTLTDIPEAALANGPSAALAEIARLAEAQRRDAMNRLRTTKFTHPLGDDHPFLAVHALARAEGSDRLDLVIAHDGALMRLHDNATDLVFRLSGDPGSAIDRQRFDYSDHKRLEHTTPEEMLAEIKRHIAGKETP